MPKIATGEGNSIFLFSKNLNNLVDFDVNVLGSYIRNLYLNADEDMMCSFVVMFKYWSRPYVIKISGVSPNLIAALVD